MPDQGEPVSESRQGWPVPTKPATHVEAAMSLVQDGSSILPTSTNFAFGEIGAGRSRAEPVVIQTSVQSSEPRWTRPLCHAHLDGLMRLMETPEHDGALQDRL